MDLQLLLEIGGLFLTLAVLLYLFIGDNALFRLVTYLFIGVAAGYVTVLIIFQVLWPRLADMIFSGNLLLMVVAAILLLMGLLLLFKLSGRFSRVGALPMAILVGIGAAVAIGGAVYGTLFGQIGSIISLFSLRQGGDAVTRLLEGVFMLVGVISTLVYFQFTTRSRSVTPGTEETTVRRAFAVDFLARIGQIFIGITLGAMFAGVFTAAISALVERIGFIVSIVLKFF